MRCDRSDHRDFARKYECEGGKACLTAGVTEGIRFKSDKSKMEAAELRFTDRQADAILEMRLYKLIGLEIEALMKEHEKTLANIARYEEILNSRAVMAKVIIRRARKGTRRNKARRAGR